MPNNSVSKIMILIPGVVAVAIAVLLFLSSGGETDLRTTAAFTLLTVLSIVLLVVIFSAAPSPVQAPASVETRIREKAARKKSEAVETTDVPGAAASTASADPAAAFISDTAGELRNSVEVIQEELEEILDDEAPADKEHMQSLYEETDRLRKIIDGMEQLSAAQAIARSQKNDPVEVAPLLNGLVEKTRTSVENNGVEYRVECEQGLVVTGDPEFLSIMIGHLANNAARSIKGTGMVTISARRVDEGTVFAVADTGTGIKRAHVDHIFERFFRGSGSGVGMGLAVVKELVDARGGKIQVQTAVGKGTTFTVKLPA